MSNNWWVECGAHIPGGHFTRNHIMTVDKVTDFREKWNNTGVFVTAYMYDNEDRSEAKLSGDFYLDLDYDIVDSENPNHAFDVIKQDTIKAVTYIKAVFRIMPGDVKIYFSGSKGIHIIVPKELIGATPDKNLNMIYRLIAEDIKVKMNAQTIDLKIYDNRRLFRLPNSKHQKTGLYKIPISYEELLAMNYDDVKDMAKLPRPHFKVQNTTAHPSAAMAYKQFAKRIEDLLNKPKGKMDDVKLDYTPPCIESLLNNPVKEGQRNETVAVLASFFLQAGHNEEQTITTLGQWNDAMCTPSISQRELETTIKSIYKSSSRVGCSKIHLISPCAQDKCKMYKGEGKRI